MANVKINIHRKIAKFLQGKAIRLIKAFVKKLIPPSIIENFKIGIQDFHSNPPILIYQMGKVGSSTLSRSLESAHLPNSIYSVHRLSHEGIKRSAAEQRVRALYDPVLSNLAKVSKTLRKKIDKTDANARWKVITLVRDPISRTISAFFENMKRVYPILIDENGAVKKSFALEFLKVWFMNYDESRDSIGTWFDKELKNVFKIDVYAYPFNHRDGFTIIRDRNVEVLIIRLEDLNQNLSHALTTFLNLERPIEMLKANVSEDKECAAAYRYVLENITIPKPICIKIYSSKYAKHFYNESMRNEFIQKWSRNEITMLKESHQLHQMIRFIISDILVKKNIQRRKVLGLF